MGRPGYEFGWAFGSVFGLSKATTSHNLCKVQNVAATSRFLHFSFVFRVSFSFLYK